MECIQKGTGDQILRPKHARRPHQELPTQTRQTETRHLRRKHKRSSEAISELAAIVEFSDNHGEQSVRVRRSHIGHHVHQSVFLDVPRTGVKRELIGTEHARGERQPNGGGSVRSDGEGEGEEFADRVGDEKEHGGENGRCGLSEYKEDICRTDTKDKRVIIDGGYERHLRSGESEEESNNPHPYGERGHLWVVDVGDSCTNFRVWTVFLIYRIEVELHPVRIQDSNQNFK